MKKKIINSFMEIKENENDFLKKFIKVGTSITLLNTNFDKEFIPKEAFLKRTIIDIENKYKIIFSKYTPDIGYLRHFSYMIGKIKLMIKHIDDYTKELTIINHGKQSIYLLENPK